jgi:hypothetical protein
MNVHGGVGAQFYNNMGFQVSVVPYPYPGPLCGARMRQIRSFSHDSCASLLTISHFIRSLQVRFTMDTPLQMLFPSLNNSLSFSFL